jgi:precorrin-2 dehydrogenase / sirohydrochlorin ferrochelatase
MSNRYYPVFLDLLHFECLLIGGGIVAERKAKTLCDANARLTIISPEITPKIQEFVDSKHAKWIRECYHKKYLQGKGLVIGATNNGAINKTIFEDCMEAGILVNIVDDPDHCTFIVPAVIRKGPLCIAISTGGAAPSVAAKIRRDIESSLCDEYVVLLTELQKLRSSIKALGIVQKKEFWMSIEALDLTNYTSNHEALRERIGSLFQEIIDK